jgi:hypothetical protein
MPLVRVYLYSPVGSKPRIQSAKYENNDVELDFLCRVDSGSVRLEKQMIAERRRRRISHCRYRPSDIVFKCCCFASTATSTFLPAPPQQFCTYIYIHKYIICICMHICTRLYMCAYIYLYNI